MKPLRYAVFALLLLACPAWATPKKVIPLVIAGDTVVVVKSLPCTVTAPAGADLYFWTLPTGVVGTTDDNVLTVTDAPFGDSAITVLAVTITITVDAKGVVTKTTTKDNGSVVLTNGVVPPPPPVPADPLTAAFQAAYALDTDANKATSLVFLAGVYKGLAGQVGARTDLTTNALIVAWMKTAIQSPPLAAGVGLTSTQMIQLRTAIGTELAKSWGTATVAVAPADAATELLKIANALAGVLPAKMRRAK